MIATQIELDYMQAANQRVAADTLILKKKATLTLTVGQNTIGLPSELIRLEALYSGSTPIDPISMVEYMQLATGSFAVKEANTVFAQLGRTLYVWPGAPSATAQFTAIYSYRPADIDTSSTFEISGSAERMLERLVSAYVLIDDGQPELGQQELASYLTDVARLKRKERRQYGRGRVLRVAGGRRTVL